MNFSLPDDCLAWYFGFSGSTSSLRVVLWFLWLFGVFSIGMTAQDYNVQVDRVNKFLKKFYEPDTRVQFWTFCGLVKPSWNIWIDDCTHLNNSVTRIYAQQIRMAVRCKKKKYWLTDWLEFYAVSTIFQSCNGGVKIIGDYKVFNISCQYFCIYTCSF